MSHNGIEKYLTDFNVFRQCYFSKGDLSIVGYQKQLLHFYEKFKKEDKDYFEEFLKSSNYLPESTVEYIFALCPELFDKPLYTDHLISLLVKYRSVVTFNFIRDISIADEILQLADHLNCIEKGLGGKTLGYLRFHTNSFPAWLKDYAESVLEENNDNT